ncbi:unnamed protein product [Vitrella brassicaformis CCMP3155]|uniref:Uncharacterized protein n=2 Tax=Vitrella brassicaformis TaxID=1169539 RepID=A0A0G4ED33_VITBC|nr:unnamed protein product [Vitrella brassicaformis CCMP3155]|eukprot:CEL93906.1 unnamed protein product [Vitrella brassicaformis CCMP3155]
MRTPPLYSRTQFVPTEDHWLLSGTWRLRTLVEGDCREFYVVLNQFGGLRSAAIGPAAATAESEDEESVSYLSRRRREAAQLSGQWDTDGQRLSVWVDRSLSNQIGFDLLEGPIPDGAEKTSRVDGYVSAGSMDPTYVGDFSMQKILSSQQFGGAEGLKWMKRRLEKQMRPAISRDSLAGLWTLTRRSDERLSRESSAALYTMQLHSNGTFEAVPLADPMATDVPPDGSRPPLRKVLRGSWVLGWPHLTSHERILGTDDDRKVWLKVSRMKSQGTNMNADQYYFGKVSAAPMSSAADDSDGGAGEGGGPGGVTWQIEGWIMTGSLEPVSIGRFYMLQQRKSSK